MQFLTDLCQLSMDFVHENIRAFYSSSLFSTRLLSQSSLESQLHHFIHHIETRIPQVFIRSFDLAHNINHGNYLLSVYGSNYRLAIRENIGEYQTVLYTEPTVYLPSDNCSCQLQMKCLTPAAFMWPDYIPLKGLFIGCLPSEAFLSSTLECFYDVDCVQLINREILLKIRSSLLSPLNIDDRSKYPLNASVNDLVNSLFVESWTSNVSYEKYYNQCAPDSCTYSYVDHANMLYTLTTLLGLYGGLQVVLSWFSAEIITGIQAIKTFGRNRRQIRPIIQ